MTQDCYNLVHQSLMGCLEYVKRLSFSSSQNSVLWFFSQLLSLVRQHQHGPQLQCSRMQFLGMSMRDAATIFKIVCHYGRWKRGFHDLVCISLIIGGSRIFFIFIGHLYVFFMNCLFVLHCWCIFLLIHKSFLHMKNTHLMLNVKIIVKRKKDQRAKKVQT